MSITGAIVLFAVIWFLVFLIVLPLGMTSQSEAGEVVPGTHASAPSEARVKRKFWITTGVTVVLWAVAAGIILSGWITIHDLDFFHRMDRH